MRYNGIALQPLDDADGIQLKVDSFCRRHYRKQGRFGAYRRKRDNNRLTWVRLDTCKPNGAETYWEIVHCLQLSEAQTSGSELPGGSEAFCVQLVSCPATTFFTRPQIC